MIANLRLVAAGVRDARADTVRQLACIAVGIDIGDDHQLLFRLGRHGAPLTVQRDDLVDVTVMHGAVTGADHIDLQVLDAIQRLVHERVPEGADDVVKIILRGAEIALRVRHRAAQDALVAVVAAERVAGEEYAVLLHIGVHGVRPVELRQDHKAQRLAAQRQRVAVLHRAAVEIVVDDLLQKAQRRGGAYHHRPGIQLQHLLDGAGVIGLRVVHDDIVNAVNGSDRPDILHIAIPVFQLVGLKERGFLAPLEDVGVVGRAKFRVHDNVEHAELRVKDSVPPKAVGQLKHLHCDLLLYSHLVMARIVIIHSLVNLHKRFPFSPFGFGVFHRQIPAKLFALAYALLRQNLPYAMMRRAFQRKHRQTRRTVMNQKERTVERVGRTHPAELL